MKDFSLRPSIRLTLGVIALVILGGCANPVIEDAHRLASKGQHEAALQRLQDASDVDQGDRKLRSELIAQRDATVNYLSYLADAARAAGRVDDVESVLHRMEAVAPQNPRVAWLRSELARFKRHEQLVIEAQTQIDAQHYDRAEQALLTVLTEDPGNAKARPMLNKLAELRETQTRKQSTLQLANANKPITLEFREASIRTVFESLARAADVNFVFDKDVRSDAKVTLFLKNTTVDEAMRVILSTQQLGLKLLNDNTVLVFPATQQKQRDLLDTVTRTFYLVNADPKQAQSLIRTVAKSRDIFVDDRLNLLVVRDTPEVMRLIERLIQNLDLADPEVMMDLEVMEVSDDDLNSVGLSWPSSASYGIPTATSSATGTTSSAVISSLSGLKGYTANPLLTATLLASHNASNILANPKIRARNREKAHVLLGEKLPVFTTTSTPTNGAISNAVSINYVDVGLKLDVEPQVQLDNEVTIKMALEVSSITNTVTGPDSSIAYQVGTRQATTTLRLKDGETQILAGLINNTESHSAAGIPGLYELPLVGRLFGLTTNENKKTQIIMLITPHIVRNVIQPATANSPMPSGTETLPGAPPLILRDDASSSGIGGQGGEPGRDAVVQARRARVVNEMIEGPEEVLPGASFVVIVRNRGHEPLRTSLSIDGTVLQFDGPNAQSGSVLLNVPAGGEQQVPLHVQPGVTQSDTVIALDNSVAEPLKLRVRAPSGAQTPGGEGDANRDQAPLQP